MSLEEEKYADDPMAQLLRDLSYIQEYYTMVAARFPKVMDILRKERILLLQEAERRVSDLWSRVDTFREGDEDSWETAMRILDHYKKTYRGN